MNTFFSGKLVKDDIFYDISFAVFSFHDIKENKVLFPGDILFYSGKMKKLAAYDEKINDIFNVIKRFVICHFFSFFHVILKNQIIL